MCRRVREYVEFECENFNHKCITHSLNQSRTEKKSSVDQSINNTHSNIGTDFVSRYKAEYPLMSRSLIGILKDDNHLYDDNGPDSIGADNDGTFLI